MRIAAVADVHCPKYLIEFGEALTAIRTPDVFLLAGDMVNFGKAKQYMNVIHAIDSSAATGVPIVACFGNEEFQGSRQEMRILTHGRIVFLDGESVILKIAESKIGIIGALAPMDFKTGTQKHSEVGLREIYESRTQHLNELMKKTAAEADYTILLMHYSPLSESLNGNDANEYSWWISKTIEYFQPDVVMHGHLHTRSRKEVLIGKTRIFNVAFPAAGKITQIDL